MLATACGSRREDTVGEEKSALAGLQVAEGGGKGLELLLTCPLDEPMMVASSLAPMGQDGFMAETYLKGGHSILVGYDLSFKEKWRRVVESGQGPLALNAPHFMGGTMDDYLVYDQMSRKFYIYSKTFSERRTVGSNVWGEQIWFDGHCYSSENKIAYISFVNHKKRNIDHYKLVKFSVENGVMRCLGEIDGYDEQPKGDNAFRYLGSPYSFCVSGEEIYILHADEGVLLVKNSEGALQRRIRFADGVGQSFTGSEQKKWLSMRRLHSGDLRLPRLWKLAWVLDLKNSVAIGLRDTYDPGLEREFIDVALLRKGVTEMSSARVPGFLSWNDPSAQSRCGLQSLLCVRPGVLISSGSETGPDGQERFVLKKWRFYGPGRGI